MVGFNGSKYYGMQFQDNVVSIERTLFEAFCKIDAISKQNSLHPSKVQFHRAARTDKGVHAACNIVSLKIIPDPCFIEKANSVLPSDIRLWETTKGFNAKNQCDSRIYEYLLPTYALREKQTNIVLKEQPGAPTDIMVRMGDNHGDERYVTMTDPSILSNYRVSQERLDKFSEAMFMFKGTHDFHNYTLSKVIGKRDTRRHIRNIEVSKPKMIQGREWISVKLHGNSFILHQIRKMISMAILCVHVDAPLSLIEESFGPQRWSIPKAPALGLLLEQPVFEYYNQKVIKEGIRDPIDIERYRSAIDQFKQDHIYSFIIHQEHQRNV
ncbi:hypothetical protein RMCBS344292_09584 [Rhizopus microsporus]|nr:hypothetical protein RMCBS344292_09584 [Rhizopus microsporus]